MTHKPGAVVRYPYGSREYIVREILPDGRLLLDPVLVRASARDIDLGMRSKMATRADPSRLVGVRCGHE